MDTRLDKTERKADLALLRSSRFDSKSLTDILKRITTLENNLSTANLRITTNEAWINLMREVGFTEENIISNAELLRLQLELSQITTALKIVSQKTSYLSTLFEVAWTPRIEDNLGAWISYFKDTTKQECFDSITYFYGTFFFPTNYGNYNVLNVNGQVVIQVQIDSTGITLKTELETTFIPALPFPISDYNRRHLGWYAKNSHEPNVSHLIMPCLAYANGEMFSEIFTLSIPENILKLVINYLNINLLYEPDLDVSLEQFCLKISAGDIAEIIELEQLELLQLIQESDLGAANSVSGVMALSQVSELSSRVPLALNSEYNFKNTVFPTQDFSGMQLMAPDDASKLLFEYNIKIGPRDGDAPFTTRYRDGLRHVVASYPFDDTLPEIASQPAALFPYLYLFLPSAIIYDREAQELHTELPSSMQHGEVEITNSLGTFTGICWSKVKINQYASISSNYYLSSTNAGLYNGTLAYTTLLDTSAIQATESNVGGVYNYYFNIGSESIEELYPLACFPVDRFVSTEDQKITIHRRSQLKQVRCDVSLYISNSRYSPSNASFRVPSINVQIGNKDVEFTNVVFNLTEVFHEERTKLAYVATVKDVLLDEIRFKESNTFDFSDPTKKTNDTTFDKTPIEEAKYETFNDGGTSILRLKNTTSNNLIYTNDRFAIPLGYEKTTNAKRIYLPGLRTLDNKVKRYPIPLLGAKEPSSQPAWGRSKVSLHIDRVFDGTMSLYSVISSSNDHTYLLRPFPSQTQGSGQAKPIFSKQRKVETALVPLSTKELNDPQSRNVNIVNMLSDDAEVLCEVSNVAICKNWDDIATYFSWNISNPNFVEDVTGTIKVTIKAERIKSDEIWLPEGFSAIANISELLTEKMNILAQMRQIQIDLVNSVSDLENRVDYLNQLYDNLEQRVKMLEEAMLALITGGGGPLGFTGQVLQMMGGLFGPFLPLIGTVITLTGSLFEAVQMGMDGDWKSAVATGVTAFTMSIYAGKKFLDRLKKRGYHRNQKKILDYELSFEDQDFLAVKNFGTYQNGPPPAYSRRASITSSTRFSINSSPPDYDSISINSTTVAPMKVGKSNAKELEAYFESLIPFAFPIRGQDSEYYFNLNIREGWRALLEEQDIFTMPNVKQDEDHRTGYISSVEKGEFEVKVYVTDGNEVADLQVDFDTLLKSINMSKETFLSWYRTSLCSLQTTQKIAHIYPYDEVFQNISVFSGYPPFNAQMQKKQQQSKIPENAQTSLLVQRSWHKLTRNLRHQPKQSDMEEPSMLRNSLTSPLKGSGWIDLTIENSAAMDNSLKVFVNTEDSVITGMLWGDAD